MATVDELADVPRLDPRRRLLTESGPYLPASFPLNRFG